VVLRAESFFSDSAAIFHVITSTLKQRGIFVILQEIGGESRGLLSQPRCGIALLSWLIAEMLDGQHKMEEAADTSSAGPLGACLFPDNRN